MLFFRRLPLVSLVWPLVAACSGVGVALVWAAPAATAEYGVLAPGFFGLMLGSVGTLRRLSGRIPRGSFEVSRSDIAFCAAFSIVLAAGLSLPVEGADASQPAERGTRTPAHSAG